MTEYEIKRLEDRIRELWNEKEDLLKENAELKKENEQEKKLNAEIKARFVKCNTCTDEMKDKCLMFSENLCEGERCEELVDLMALVNKSDLQKENEQLEQQIEKMRNCGNCRFSYCERSSERIDKDGNRIFHCWNEEKEKYCDVGKNGKYQCWEIKE